MPGQPGRLCSLAAVRFPARGCLATLSVWPCRPLPAQHLPAPAPTLHPEPPLFVPVGVKTPPGVGTHRPVGLWQHPAVVPSQRVLCHKP